MMNLPFRGAAAIVGILLAAGPICGSTVLQTETFGPQSTNWGLNATTGTVNGSVALSFNKFDPSLGTLESVTFTLSGNVMSDVFAANLGATAAQVTARAQATLTLTRPDLTTLVVIVPTNTLSQMLAKPNYIPGSGESLVAPTMFTDANGAWVGNGPNGNSTDDKINFTSPSLSGPTGGGHNANTFASLATATGSNSATVTSAADLLLFTGPGTISLPLGALGQGRFTDGANAFELIRTQASGTVSVTYDYVGPPSPAPGVVVPEPASVIVGAIGGIGSLIVYGLRRHWTRACGRNSRRLP
jgi:hypothetical protein